MEVVVGGGEKLYSKNLRDFLKMEEDNQRNLNQNTASSSGASRRSSSGLTLSAILNEKIGQFPPADEPLRRVESNGTLLDIIRDDRTSSLSHGNGRRSWQHLTDKIRLRRRGGGSAWPAAVPTSSSDFNNNNRQRMVTATATGHRSIRFNSNMESGGSIQPDSRAPVPLRNPRRSPENESRRFEPMSSSSSLRSRLITDENHQNENWNGECPSHAVETEAEGGGSPEQPMRMSLMSLLAENDRQMGFETSAYVMDEVEAGEDVDEGSGTSSGVEYNNCCVCMLRHKGAAFIPCGHTFCRLCSRELWVQRGNCPLCNNFILEILDIF